MSAPTTYTKLPKLDRMIWEIVIWDPAVESKERRLIAAIQQGCKHAQMREFLVTFCTSQIEH